MATYKILYWQEDPFADQSRGRRGRRHAADARDRFMERIDLLAAQRGLQDADDYLAQWKWSEEEEREGSAQEVAAAVKAELEAQADW